MLSLSYSTAATSITKSENNRIRVMGIESSCDDSACGILEYNYDTKRVKILAQTRISQDHIHRSYGGIVPILAAKEHKLKLQGVTESVLRNANMGLHQLDAIAVTIGPGLSPCLHAGVDEAFRLRNESSNGGKNKHLPLIPVHHMEGHALMGRLSPYNSNINDNNKNNNNNNNSDCIEFECDKVKFPFLSLLISGGHCLLVQVNNPKSYVQLGTTLDDAPGEAFDKVARLLNVPEGGAGVEKLAQLSQLTPKEAVKLIKMPIPMRGNQSCDFSFAGVKSFVKRLVEGNSQTSFLEKQRRDETSKNNNTSITIDNNNTGSSGNNTNSTKSNNNTEKQDFKKEDIANAFQTSVTFHLKERTERGIIKAKTLFPQIETLVVSGGAASNRFIYHSLIKSAAAFGISVYAPPPHLCVDNGVMIAWAAIENISKYGMDNCVMKEDCRREEVDVRPKWKLEELRVIT